MLNPNSMITLNNQFWPSSKQCWLRVIEMLALTLLLSLHKPSKTMPLLSPLLRIYQIINVKKNAVLTAPVFFKNLNQYKSLHHHPNSNFIHNNNQIFSKIPVWLIGNQSINLHNLYPKFNKLRPRPLPRNHNKINRKMFGLKFNITIKWRNSLLAH
jgi:hypothetical protein